MMIGGATRLASLLAGGDKTYDAAIRLGVSTDTDDAAGAPVGEACTDLPDEAAVYAALEKFRGTFAQVPPTHSAKHVAGQRAYDLARKSREVTLEPVDVTVHALESVRRDGDVVHIRIVCSPGFYVRALARDLGRALGCGAHLAALRRVRSGTFDVADAVSVGEADRLGRAIEERLIRPADALPQLPSVTVTEAGLNRATHGNPIGPEHLTARWIPPAASGRVRVLGPAGRLVALAESRGGALHPVVVLG
jgi:tRNA pseudouridine55 synthase